MRVSRAISGQTLGRLTLAPALSAIHMGDSPSQGCIMVARSAACETFATSAARAAGVLCTLNDAGCSGLPVTGAQHYYGAHKGTPT